MFTGVSSYVEQTAPGLWGIKGRAVAGRRRLTSMVPTRSCYRAFKEVQNGKARRTRYLQCDVRCPHTADNVHCAAVLRWRCPVGSLTTASVRAVDAAVMYEGQYGTVLEIRSHTVDGFLHEHQGGQVSRRGLKGVIRATVADNSSRRPCSSLHLLLHVPALLYERTFARPMRSTSRINVVDQHIRVKAGTLHPLPRCD